MTVQVALLFQEGNFVGREYYRCLNQAGMTPSLLLSVGRMSEESIDREKKRTAGRWNPPPLPVCAEVTHFDTLADPELWRTLHNADIDIAIQGGIGILKPEMLKVPRVGFLNVHPGRLPAYRGSSCPEWALLNGESIYATAHLIDEGIDTGPIICEQRYVIEPQWDYYDIRANLYAHCAKVLVEALMILNRGHQHLPSILTYQPETGGKNWRPIPQDKIASLIARFSL